MGFIMVDAKAHPGSTARQADGLQNRHATEALAAPLHIEGSAKGRNRRWSERQNSEMPGVLGASLWPQSFSCKVLDLSKHGAMLELGCGAGDGTLPECLTLVFYNRRTRCEANCVVRWRRDNRVGVCFAGPVRSMIGRQ